MRIKSYNRLIDEAMIIRKSVFCDEQGFIDEFDDIDNISTHYIAWDNDKPVGTCRTFFDKNKNCYVLGRLAIIKNYRGQKLGEKIVEFAELNVKNQGGKEIILHSQEQAMIFYEKQGYKVFGDMEYEEHCPHYWMRKTL